MRDLKGSNLFHLGHTPNLRSLNLVLGPDPHVLIPWVRSFFEPLLKSDYGHPLQFLTIQLIFANAYHLDEWATFDALFQKIGFASLAKVNIRILGSMTPSDAVELLSETFLYLKGLGKLEVSNQRRFFGL